MNQSSLLAEFGDPITRVENALIALKEGRGSGIKCFMTVATSVALSLLGNLSIKA